MGIIAGLGVGGLAVALAARPTIENLIASIVIYIDNTIRVGDHIEAHDIAGIVEHIGMRSAHIRAPDGCLIFVTNSDLAGRIVKNNSRRIDKSLPPHQDKSQP